MTRSRNPLWELVRQHENNQFRLAGSIRQHGRVIKTQAWHERPGCVTLIHREAHEMLEQLERLLADMERYWEQVRDLAREEEGSEDA